jgi:hypothetical protein
MTKFIQQKNKLVWNYNGNIGKPPQSSSCINQERSTKVLYLNLKTAELGRRSKQNSAMY